MTGGAAPMERLQRALRGPVLVPDHPAYDVARTTFNGMIDHRPAHDMTSRVWPARGIRPTPKPEGMRIRFHGCPA